MVLVFVLVLAFGGWRWWDSDLLMGHRSTVTGIRNIWRHHGPSGRVNEDLVLKEGHAVLVAAAKRAILHAEDSHSRKAERSANSTLFS